jgi:hypothetical protein
MSWLRSLASYLYNATAVQNVAFGSLADICTATDHVRFTPKSGHSAA